MDPNQPSPAQRELPDFENYLEEAQRSIRQFDYNHVRSFITIESQSIELRKDAVLYEIGRLLDVKSPWGSHCDRPPWEDSANFSAMVSNCITEAVFGQQRFINSIEHHFYDFSQSIAFETFKKDYILCQLPRTGSCTNEP